MYFFPFNASHLITSTGSSTFVVDNIHGDECSPLTEFYNGTIDRMFFGVGSSTNGLLQSSTITSSLTTPACASPPSSSCVRAPNSLGGTSGIVIDNQLSNGGTNIYFTTLAAGSGKRQKWQVSRGTAKSYWCLKPAPARLQ